MKASVLAALLGATSAVSLNDAPPHFNEPTFGQSWPSAAGLVQTNACMSSNTKGVTCENNLVQFAEGMRGDEDLGQDITMKGQPFHYAQETPTNATKSFAQWNPVVVKSAPGSLPLCHGTNGPDGVNCARDMCNGTNGPKDGESGTPCQQAEPAGIPHYNADPQAGRPYSTTGDGQNSVDHTAGGRPTAADAVPMQKSFLQTSFDPDYKFQYESAPAEGVHVLQTKIGRTSTTFY